MRRHHLLYYAGLLALAILAIGYLRPTGTPREVGAFSIPASPTDDARQVVGTAPDLSTPSAHPSAKPSPSAPTTRAPRAAPVTSAPAGCRSGGTVPIDRPQATGGGPEGSHTNTGTRAVALTFDDGPDPVNTPKILDLLKHCGVKATFCVEGAKAQQNPALIRRIYAEGHTFCNHTWRHIRQLGSYGPARIRQDLTDTNNAIRAIVPNAKISYFRAPGGVWTKDYVTVARELGMTPIHWDVDTSDWNSAQYGTGQAMTNHIIAVVQSEVRPGSIILSHDYQKPDTTAAYRVLLPWLLARFTLIALPVGGLPPIVVDQPEVSPSPEPSPAP